MKCFSEQQLEQLVWGNTGISEEKRKHLFDCDRCRERYLVLATLHRAMLNPLSDSPCLTDDVTRTERTNAPVLLAPVRPSGVENIFSHRLAACGEQPAELYAVSSFSNPDMGIVGRLLFNRQSHHLKLFLIAESGEVPHGYKVVLSEGGLTGIVDNKGCVDFGTQPESRFKALEIINPRGVYDFSLAPSLAPQKPKNDLLAMAEQSQGRIEVTIDRSETGARYLVTVAKPDPAPASAEWEVVGITDRRIISTTTRDGLTLLEIAADEEMLRICIY